MKIYADLHVHTVSSGHAYSTVAENAKLAKQKGLEIMGISDHTAGLPGGAHVFHFNNLRIIPRVIHGVTILRGAEVNIVDYNGNIDLEEFTLRGLDYAIASYHPPCVKSSDDANEVTRGLISAMHNPYVRIIGHPGDTRYPLNFEETVKAAKATNTLLEVNNASLKPTSFRPGVRDSLIEMLKFCNKYDCPIIIGTDAHICYDVGEFGESINLLEQVQFPNDLIINSSPNNICQFLNCVLD
ncbi:MAG: phosphatase [Epulopiscium sp. Nuni2H_MBin001]|nr:MAG: phosphatase [Epulopiscium sp. Nuni2H_MBin001]